MGDLKNELQKMLEELELRKKKLSSLDFKQNQYVVLFKPVKGEGDLYGVLMVEKALASFLEKGAGRKSPCDNCRDFYDNEYGSCAFGCSKLREFEGREPDYDLLG